jgi:hypothetical protein
VGTEHAGFINFGPQTRSLQPAANWQTSGLIGGGGTSAGAAPAQMSQIWNTPAAPPGVPQQPRAPPPAAGRGGGMPPGVSMPPGVGGPRPAAFPGAADAGKMPDSNMSALFAQLGIDSAAAAPPVSNPFAGGVGGAGAYGGLNNVGAMGGSGVEPNFLNGVSQPTGGASQAQAAQLMSLLQTPTSVGGGAMGNAFAMGNGVPPSAGRGQAFNPGVVPPSVPQLPMNGGSHAAAFAPPNAYGGGGRPGAGGAPPRPGGPSAPPRNLSSTADYAAAAQSWKPPTGTAKAAATSASRKPETQKASAATTAAAAAQAEWECSRCTFLNNAALWECEMCGSERPGKQAQPAVAAAAAAIPGRAPAAQDDGWQTAGNAVRKAAPSASAEAAANAKSKAQAKNEKRRAKKRGD